MNIKHLPKYDEKTKRFRYSKQLANITDTETKWEILHKYLYADQNQHNNVIYGYKACCDFINNKNKELYLHLCDLSELFEFKEDIFRIIHDLCYGGYVITSPTICDKCINMWKKCKNIYHSACTNKDTIFKLLTELHKEENDLIKKMFGLRVFKNIR